MKTLIELWLIKIACFNFKWKVRIYWKKLYASNNRCTMWRITSKLCERKSRREHDSYKFRTKLETWVINIRIFKSWDFEGNCILQIKYYHYEHCISISKVLESSNIITVVILSVKLLYIQLIPSYILNIFTMVMYQKSLSFIKLWIQYEQDSLVK